MAILIKILGGIYTVYSDGKKLECRARGLFRHTGETPLVGDEVEISCDETGYTIQRLLPRRNEFVRPPVANVDVMVIVASAAIPVTEPFLIDRMAAVARSVGVQPVICINKSDIDSADGLFEIYSRSTMPVYRLSAVSGEGVSELVGALYGSVSVLTGNSGVGKSSILNALGLDIAVGEVSDKLGRGRHTTRHVEIHALQGSNGQEAYVIDTPGFSSFDTGRMALTEQSDIEHGFPEFEPYLGSCRFRDCAHVKEPGCAVLDALKSGEIDASRHKSYVRLLEIAKELKAKEYK